MRRAVARVWRDGAQSGSSCQFLTSSSDSSQPAAHQSSPFSGKIGVYITLTLWHFIAAPYDFLRPSPRCSRPSAIGPWLAHGTLQLGRCLTKPADFFVTLSQVPRSGLVPANPATRERECLEMEQAAIDSLSDSWQCVPLLRCQIRHFSLVNQ